MESRRHGAEVEALIFWNRFGRELHLLPYFGAIPVNERVVVDGAWVFAAGVTAGIDGALRLAAELRADEAAQAIQLDMVYAPEPPFNSGTPAAILEQARQSVRKLTTRREETALRTSVHQRSDSFRSRVWRTRTS